MLIDDNGRLRRVAPRNYSSLYKDQILDVCLSQNYGFYLIGRDIYSTNLETRGYKIATFPDNVDLSTIWDGTIKICRVMDNNLNNYLTTLPAKDNMYVLTYHSFYKETNLYRVSKIN